MKNNGYRNDIALLISLLTHVSTPLRIAINTIDCTMPDGL